ncbi:malonyl-CoA-acyl carrier protein transacylase, mitochondrial-like [Lytechinus variegatus]|uniref:malonyl-CoA-acyl carrier protein transacylase, mitochondrial-like n=1 Tax=Lytechinus variegatus TaxID=7654 RepID=UPI001BB11179|nr:malonyl-CoA-acyl carrier protein transacylase, mitochondrial-like [Lytechinus variegatus]XP_041455145.1 malonyl-CoA-acyl carrier protein transacylase, mitochondrial-like [Lytechinus variegatus]XP_041455146.1 malonyl-CoA-acyl carrier protein transacylase, mitochondrial-like [Lytechinus variegatus]
MDKMNLLRSVWCLQYHTSRRIGHHQKTNLRHYLTNTTKEQCDRSVPLHFRRFPVKGVQNVGVSHLHHSWLCSLTRLSPKGCLETQPSQLFSTSSMLCDASRRNEHNAKGSRDTDEALAASKERHASIRTLLDDAKTDEKLPDEFDFDGDLETSSVDKRRQSGKPRIDPAETSVLLFPGQGSQFVGMGRDLLKYPNVEDMFAVASEILGYDLLSLCVNGPVEELNRTIHCQPAVVVTSLAAVEKLKEEQPKAIENCVAAAGFSVGEFAALVFGGSISFEDAIHLIKIRAESMQLASEAVSSGMISVVGGKKARYKFICKEAENYCRNHHGIAHPVCKVANYLYPDARVLAGHTETLSFIKDMSRSFYLRAIKPIPVSGAFHTPLMSSAQEPISRALDAVAIETPVIGIHSNVDGKAYGSPKHVRKQLKKQVVEPVMWEQTMHCIYEREKGTPFPFTYEMGPGNQLGTILKRNNLKASNSYANVKV